MNKSQRRSFEESPDIKKRLEKSDAPDCVYWHAQVNDNGTVEQVGPLTVDEIVDRILGK